MATKFELLEEFCAQDAIDFIQDEVWLHLNSFVISFHNDSLSLVHH